MKLDSKIKLGQIIKARKITSQKHKIIEDETPKKIFQIAENDKTMDLALRILLDIGARCQDLVYFTYGSFVE